MCLLRYFSFVLRSYHLYHIRPVSFGRRKKRNKKKREGGNNTTGHPFFSFFSHNTNEEQEHKNTRDERRESQKKTEEEKKSPPTNTKKKRGRREKGSDCRFRFHLHREASLPLEIRESSSLASDTTLESASSSRNAFRGEREREFARFSRRENVRFFFLGNFKRLRETAFEI